MKYEEILKKINILRGQQEALVKEKDETERTLIEANKKAELLEDTRIFLLELSKKQRESVIADFSQMTTNALRFITGEDIAFEIEIDESRGAAEVNFFLKINRAGNIVKTDLEDTHGDGYLDIVALALNIIMYLRTNNKAPLILDEPCKQLSEAYRQGAGEFLQQIADEFGIQIFMITNIAQFADYGHNKYRVSLNGDYSVITTNT